MQQYATKFYYIWYHMHDIIKIYKGSCQNLLFVLVSVRCLPSFMCLLACISLFRYYTMSTYVWVWNFLELLLG